MGGLRQLSAAVIAMSLPLFFSHQLKSPPVWLNGLPFVALWTWGVIAAVVLPVLLIVEGATCAWLRWRRTAAHPKLGWHMGAMLIGIAAEVVFIVRRNS